MSGSTTDGGERIALTSLAPEHLQTEEFLQAICYYAEHVTDTAMDPDRSFTLPPYGYFGARLLSTRDETSFSLLFTKLPGEPRYLLNMNRKRESGVKEVLEVSLTEEGGTDPITRYKWNRNRNRMSRRWNRWGLDHRTAPKPGLGGLLNAREVFFPARRAFEIAMEYRLHSQP